MRSFGWIAIFQPEDKNNLENHWGNRGGWFTHQDFNAKGINHSTIYICVCILGIYSLVPGPRTAQARIRLVKLVNSVTTFRRGIDKFH